MRALKTAALCALLAFGAGEALAHGKFHHYRPRVGIVIGAPVVFAPWYPPLYYYPRVYVYPPGVVVGPPLVYVEQAQTWAAAERVDHHWYYCPEAKGYYPYVRECPGGWQRVAPRPPW
jgi:hypothetical protein